MQQSDLLITKRFEAVAKEHGDEVCFVLHSHEDAREYTYSQTVEKAKAAGAFLQSRGVGQGDFVLLAMSNCPEWFIVYMGVLYAGATAVPVSGQGSRGEIQGAAKHCQARFLFADEQVLERVEPVEMGMTREQVVVAGDGYDGGLPLERVLSEESGALEQGGGSGDSFASLIYTSGTTGEPKGVLLTHANLCSNVESMLKLGVIGSEDVILSVLPLSHTYAFTGSVLAPLLAGGQVVMCGTLKPTDMAEAMRQYNVTVLLAVPQLLSMLRDGIFRKYDKSMLLLKPLVMMLTRFGFRKKLGKSLRMFVSGGARLEPSIARDLTRLGVNVVEGYGLTETSPIAALNPPDAPKLGSVGKAVPDVSIRIDNADAEGIGDVLIKGPNVMAGYFHRRELTDEVIVDGWFRSGDLGYVDEDGYLFITGRSNDVIVLASGKNIYPDEVEDAYLKNPYISEICILAGKNGKGLHAVIVPDIEYFRENNVVNIRERLKWELENIAGELPSHQHVTSFVVAEEPLPRTRLGKIKRFEVRAKYVEGEAIEREEEGQVSGSDAELLDLASSARALELLEGEIGHKVRLSDNLELDLGVDSLGRIEMADKLETSMGIKIADERISGIFTVRDVLAVVNDSEISEEGRRSVAVEEFGWKSFLLCSPPDSVRTKIHLRPTLFDGFITLLGAAVFHYLFGVFFRLSVRGRENLPKTGPFVLCPNHASFFDGPIVAVALPLKVEFRTFFLGYSKYLEHPLLAWAGKATRLIPIDPAVQLTEALHASAFVLQNEKVVCVFPEGQRSIGPDVGRFKKGVAILAKELDVPVVPVYIRGSHEAWPRGQKWPRFQPVSVHFGRPIQLDGLGVNSRNGSCNYQLIADRIRDEVIKLGAESRNG